MRRSAETTIPNPGGVRAAPGEKPAWGSEARSATGAPSAAARSGTSASLAAERPLPAKTASAANSGVT
jgi:hypothetical protein